MKSIAAYGEKGFPFALVSDAEKTIFKAYRAYDDFENAPLHATCLIDTQGLMRWWDIGPEPFREVDFLLKESQRLLKLPQPSPSGNQPVPVTPAAGG